MPHSQEKLCLLRAQIIQAEEHFRGVGYNDEAAGHGGRRRRGVASHARSWLLADVADRTTVTGELGLALAVLRRSRTRHDPGRVLVEMAVAVADGATTISDVAVLADQAALFGAVASDSTCWRLLDRLDTPQLRAVALARAAAREVVWAQRAERAGRPIPPAHAAGRELPGLVIGLGATVVVCHSEKEEAAPTFKQTFGYHPMRPERGQQHRRRPHPRPGRCARAGARPAPPRHPDPGPGRRRRLHPRVPRAPPSAA